MKYDRKKHHRQSIRLKEYDYTSAGRYFITICSHQRECLFGEVVDGIMQLNDFGQIVAEEWERSPNLRQEIKLDAWIVMPNHFHGIVFIEPVAYLGANNHDVGINDHAVGAQGLAPLQSNGLAQSDAPLQSNGLPQSDAPLQSNGLAQSDAPLQSNGLAQSDAPLPTNMPNRKPRSLGSFIAGFKMAVTKRINLLRGTPRVPIWQRNYYEHIIRNEAALYKIREYVETNPISWNIDQLHPHNASKW
ncbi:MAG: transposase [Nostoc sp.]|uniref:transposase n=1 Tax=Nostoc sp. TaxID=1180 RepID=UPI002FF7DAD0